MDPTLTNFGAAGLIAALWLLERRHGAARDRALEQAHERLLAERRDADRLLRVVRDTTRALTAVERTQRAVLTLLDSLNRARWPIPGDAPDHAGPKREPLYPRESRSRE